MKLGLGQGAQESISTILGIVQMVGIAIAIAMIMYVGIKFMSSSYGKKADAKETLIPVLIGAALLALAPTIVKWVFDTFEKT